MTVLTTAPMSATHPVVSPARRLALRACYLLLVVGLGLTAWPRLILASPDQPLMTGVVDAMLCGMQLLAIVGLFSPVRMLAVIVFDVLWKLIWVGVVAVPLAVSGEISAGVAETLFACAWAVPFLVIVPWVQLAQRLLGSPEPWRGSRTHEKLLPTA
ncbi:MAG: hypothetical protein KIT89_04335 [Microcella sp.]|uniref:hypothetical protein n=1 Tax=Microcella sp. TaxID=1913979 RepID=UPI0024CDCF3A|nr:hypothetical protein [Microcella sp.]UYN84426.1 MAG: hypothetical protein KIT89_04335 [Microcella sp.]